MSDISIQGRRWLAPGIVLALGLTTQAIWQFAVPWYWGWDSVGYLAIGRMYFHLPYHMWAIKNYYGPGYPIFLTLMGVHHLDTLRYLAAGTWLVGGTMPYFLYRAIEPFHRTSATIAAVAFAGCFGNAVLSTDMMNHHFHAFSLVVMASFFSRYYFHRSLANAVWLSVVAALSNTIRGSSVFIFIWAVGTLAVVVWVERRRLQSSAQVALILAGLYVATTLLLSAGRVAVLGGPFQYGLTQDIGTRVMFQGAYYGASIFEKQFYPEDDPVFVRPENGPASRKLFAAMKAYIEDPHINAAELHLSEKNDKQEAYQSLILRPTHFNTYLFWWGYDGIVGSHEAQRQLRKVVIETILSQPRILKYYAWNLWNFLFGPELLPETGCIDCKCPPCFTKDRIDPRGPSFMGKEVFADVAGPGLIAEMRQEFNRSKKEQTYREAVYSVVRFAFGFKPLLTFLLFLSVLVARGPTRYVAIYFLGAVLVLAGTTSLAWPGQFRYVYPIFPFLFGGAAIAVTDISARIVEFRRSRS